MGARLHDTQSQVCYHSLGQVVRLSMAGLTTGAWWSQVAVAVSRLPRSTGLVPRPAGRPLVGRGPSWLAIGRDDSLEQAATGGHLPGR